MGLQDQPLSPLRPLNEAQLAEWEEAYSTVEAYLRSLRLKNRLLIAELVRAILWRASERQAKEPNTSAKVLAMEETLSEMAHWTQEVLDEPLQNNRLSARGRLALLLADMPGHWQGVFLTPAPWPKAFVDSMRSSYLAAGPQFAKLTMTPRPLELNVLGTGAAQWWDTMDRRPIVRKMFLALVILLLGALIALLIYR